MEIIDDVSRLPERAKRELIRGEHARAEFAIFAQTMLKETLDAMGPLRQIDGLGRKVTTIHPELAARLRVKYGISCLHDPDFLRALLRDNPFLRVQCVPAALTLRVNGLRGRRSEVGPLTSKRLESGPNKGSAGQQSAQLQRKDGRCGPGGDPATPHAHECVPVIKQTAGASLVSSEVGGRKSEVSG